LARRPFKVAAVALAKKMARIAWAMLAKGGTYRTPATA
jgi:transposase